MATHSFGEFFPRISHCNFLELIAAFCKPHINCRMAMVEKLKGERGVFSFQQPCVLPHHSEILIIDDY